MATASERSLSGSYEDVKPLLEAITSEGRELAQNETVSCANLIGHARDLIAALESPLESIFRITFAEPSRMAVSRLALDLKIFDTLATDNGRPKTATELAAPANDPPKLVSRLARHMASMGRMD